MGNQQHINPSARIIGHIANGLTGVFSYNFVAWTEDGLEVYLNGVLQLTTSYTVSGVGEFNGGTVALHSIPESGTIVTIVGDTPRKQATDYNQYVTLTVNSMNLDANFQETQIQETTTLAKRALLAPVSDGVPEYAMVLPDKDERKDSYLAFDEQGYPIARGMPLMWSRECRVPGVPHRGS
jgi:hypothetical protein